MTGAGDDVGPAQLRQVVRELRLGDPGPLAAGDRLHDVGLVGLDLLACVATLEERFGIEFPADLIPALETVGDLAYFTSVKLSQR